MDQSILDPSGHAVPDRDDTPPTSNGPNDGGQTRFNPNGNTYYLHHDQIGSTRMITDASAASVGTFTYDAYGTQTGATGTVTSNLGYAGQYTDAETGFQYFRNRYYDPTTGQFLTRDPAVPETRAPYSYAANSPWNATDPDGLSARSVIAGMVAKARAALQWLRHFLDQTFTAAGEWISEHPGLALKWMGVGLAVTAGLAAAITGSVALAPVFAAVGVIGASLQVAGEALTPGPCPGRRLGFAALFGFAGINFFGALGEAGVLGLRVAGGASAYASFAAGVVPGREFCG